MSQTEQDTGTSAGALHGEPGLVWAASAAVAGFGAWTLFDARPGLNWVLWTGAAVAGLLLIARRRRRLTPPIVALGGVPVVIAGAATVTASQELLPLIFLAVVFLLALQMLLVTGTSLGSITVRFAVLAPVVALREAVLQVVRRGIEATDLIRSPRARERVRGLAITLPVLVVFALLLASADPVLAGWRDAIVRLVESWAFVPRVIFFLALLVIVLGAYAYASFAPERVPAAGMALPQWLGATERVMLLAGVAALFWLFLAMQAGYLFGNLPRVAASGVTFAEYARRGFGELTVVASASALLIIAAELFGKDDGRERTLRALTFAVIAAVLLLLGSAFRRVWLYEAAYGFTTARLFAQVYMCAVAVGLALLAREVAGTFDVDRLFRRAAAAVTVLFIALVYWNHEAWIARRNMDRFASTGQLDIAYLARGLSDDAIPAIAERLPLLPEPLRSELRRAVQERHAARTARQPRAWYEWNRAAGRARQALAESFSSP